MCGEVRVDKQESVIGEFEAYPASEQNVSIYIYIYIYRKPKAGVWGTYIPPLLPNRPPAKPAVTKSLSNPAGILARYI